jgi:hypothetical protein
MFAVDSPPTLIEPDDGRIRRFTIRSEVVFPHPDGPTSTVNFPVGAENVSPSTAATPSPYRLDTFSKEIIVILPYGMGAVELSAHAQPDIDCQNCLHQESHPRRNPESPVIHTCLYMYRCDARIQKQSLQVEKIKSGRTGLS